MRQVNTGNILPFYPAFSLTSNSVHKSVVQHFVGVAFNLIPFQIILPTSAGSYRFELYDDANNFVADLSGGVVETLFDNTQAAYTYSATVALPLINCKVYQIRVSFANTGVRVYDSEWMMAKTKWDYTIIFGNNTDIGEVFYQNGYMQKLHFDGFEDAPLVDYVSEKTLLLTGKERTTSSRQVEKRVIVGHNFVRSQLSSLSRIQQHKQITLFEKAETTGVTVDNLEFTLADSDEFLSDGRFVFDVSIASVTGCGENTFTIL